MKITGFLTNIEASGCSAFPPMRTRPTALVEIVNANWDGTDLGKPLRVDIVPHVPERRLKRNRLKIQARKPIRAPWRFPGLRIARNW